jgi:hypothetical protein
MLDEQKTLKDYAKEAKKRLKQGFWQNYHENLNSELKRARQEGISESKIKEYYAEKVSDELKNRNAQDDEFYVKVKRILDEEGEVSNAIGRLTDHVHYSTLSYDEKQRYILNLSERYLKAVERYRKEKAIEGV